MDYSGLENRRKRPRVTEDLKVHINILSSPEDESLTGLEFDCHTKDISFQGMCLISDIRVNPGLTLELRVQAGTPAQDFSFTGMVMWCNFKNEAEVYEAGIQITDLDGIPIGWKKLVIDLIVNS